MAEPVNNPILGNLRGIRRSLSPGFFRSPTGQKQDGGEANSNALINRNSILLSNISTQLDNINKQNVILTKTLEVISVNLTNSSLLERKKEAERLRQEQLLAEQGLRGRKEAAIESKIQSALLSPVKKIAEKTQFSLGKLTSLFGILLGGWLIDNVFDLLKANSEGNQDKVKEITNNIIKGLAISGTTFLLVGAAITGFQLILGKLALTLAGFAARGVFLKPIASLGKLLVTATSLALGLNLGGAKTPGGGGLRWFGQSKKNNNPQPNVKPGSKFAKPSGVTTTVVGIQEGMDVLTGVDTWWEAGIDLITGLGLASLSRPMVSKVKHPVARGLLEALLYFGLLNIGSNVRDPIQDAITGDDKKNSIDVDVTEEDGKNDEVSSVETKTKGEVVAFNTKETDKTLNNVVDAETRRSIFQDPVSDATPNLGITGDGEKIAMANITPVKKDTTTVEQNVPDDSPEIVTIPALQSSGNEEEPVTVAASTGAGGIPSLIARNESNNYVFLAYKHYQVVPL